MQKEYEIISERQGDDVVITLKGEFYKSNLANVREKLEQSIDCSGIFFFLNVDKAVFEDNCFLDIFLDLLNALKKRSAKLLFIRTNPEKLEYFTKYSAIFEFTESRKDYHKLKLLGQLKQVGIFYSKKTGIRVTPSVAIVLAFILLGWFLTLVGIIYNQNKELAERRAEVIMLENDVKRSLVEIDRLQASIGPLQNLGLVGSEQERNSFGTVRDWMHYLDMLDSARREN